MLFYTFAAWSSKIWYPLNVPFSGAQCEAMNFKDYYAELEVAPDVDDQAIKQAYRRLAREYHPDVKPGDTRAEERFKAINEAYQTLSDPERRKKYDMLRQWHQYGGAGGFDSGQWQYGPGARVYTGNISVEDLEDLFGNGSFADMFGSMMGQTGSSYTPRPRRGRDIEVPDEVTLEEAFSGTTRTVHIGDNRIEARIPPGVYTGSRVRIAGKGMPGTAGGSSGDLYLVVQVQPHPLFERDGNDLKTEASVDFYTAAIGGKTRVVTLDGTVTLKIPPRTQAGKMFRLSGKGMPRLDKPQERGDLYARIKIVLPESMSDAELDALRNLAHSRQTVSYSVPY